MLRLPEERNLNLTLFKDVAKIEQRASHEYAASVDPRWSYGAAAHGGYLVSLIWRAIAIHFDTTLKTQAQPDTFSFHIEFLRPCATGEVSITVKDVRLGRGTSTIHVSLAQEGIERCVVYASNAGQTASKGTITKHLGYHLYSKDAAPPPIDYHKVLTMEDPNWIRYDVIQDPKIPNWALGNVIYCMLRKPARAHPRINQQWICFHHPDARWTNETLGIALDINVVPPEQFFDDAPHSYFSMGERAEKNEREGKSTWDHPPWQSPRFYATASMSIEVKRQLPVEGVKWLLARWETREVVNGRFDADIELWDANGDLIANASSLWYLVDVTRTAAAGLEKRAKAARFSATRQSKL